MAKKNEATPLSVAQRIDSQCDQFEALWKAGKKPKLEDFLGSSQDKERSELFRALLAVEVELRSKQGQKAGPDPYLKRFPDLSAVITEVFKEVRDAAGRDTSVSQSAARTKDAEPKKPQVKPKDELPKTIGRFQVLDVLGEGAFGKVFRARDPHLDREVAIKMPRAGTLEKENELERFLREAKSAATIQHPNICPVFEVGQDGANHYIVMAYIAGQSLGANLKARKEPMPPKQAALLCRKLALALEAAHSKGIIHRDLKPGNIMVDRDRKDLIIMDFGLARRVSKGEANLTQSGVLMGTPAYMPPEQARGEPKAVGPWSDVYSLGAILYEMLTLQKVFSGSVAEVIGKVLHVEPEPPSKHRADVDPALAAICMKALEKDTAKRFRSMKDLADALGQYLKGAAESPTAAPSVSIPSGEGGTEMRRFNEVVQALSAERKAHLEAVEQAVKRAKPPWWVWVAGAGAVAAIVLLGIIFFARLGRNTVMIVLPGIDLQDRTLTFWLDQKPVPGETFERPVPLAPGQHELLVKRGDEVIRRLVLTVRGDERGGVIGVEDIPVTPPMKQQTPDDGYRPLFNGKDLTGWVKKDGKPAEWTVKDGYLEVIPGKGDLITTEKFGPDFDLHVDFWVPKEGKSGQRGNSGVYLQGRHEIQIMDSYQNEVNPKTSCGALYNAIAPSQNVSKPPEEWQTFDISFHAPRVDNAGKPLQPGKLTVVHNGIKVIDNAEFAAVASAQFLDNKVGQPGPILLQDRGSNVRFKNIKIRPRQETGWQTLFPAGKELENWEGQPGAWKVDRDEIVGSPADKKRTWLISKKPYRDFELKFQVKLKDGKGGSGVVVRGQNAGPFDTRGPMIKIGDGWGGWGSLTWEVSGTPKIAMPAALQETVEKVVNKSDFNDYFIKCEGKHITIQVNGITTADTDWDPLPEEGILGFQFHGGKGATEEVRFRNAFIRDLPPEVGWEPLFNGKDLTGWDGKPGNWIVEGGDTVGLPLKKLPSTYLISQKSYSDFELKAQMQIKKSTGSGGIVVRGDNKGKFMAGGPLILAGDGWGGWGQVTASIVRDPRLPLAPETKAALEKAINKDDFNDFYVKCQGKHLTVKINGVTAADQDWDFMPNQGIVAFLVHVGDGMTEEVRVRKAFIREIKTSGVAKSPGELLEIGRFQMKSQVNAVAFHPDHRTVYAGDHSGYVVAWDLGTQQVIKEFQLTNAHIASLAITPDGQHLLVTNGKRIREFDLIKGSARIVVGDDGPLTVIGARNGNLSVSPDGQRLLLAGEGRAWLLDRQNGKPIDILPAKPGPVHWGSFSPDGKWILLCAQNTAFLIDATTGKQVKTFQQPREWFLHGTFSPDNRFLLNGSNAFFKPQLWDIEKAALVRDFAGHTAHVLPVVFYPDGKHFLSGSHDGTVRLWEMATGKEVQRLTPDPSAEVHCLAVSRDGRHAVSGDNKNQVHIWGYPDPIKPSLATPEELRAIDAVFKIGGSVGLLTGDQIGYDSRSLAELPKVPFKLFAVLVNGRPVNDAWLANLAGLPNLGDIRFAGTKITDAGLEHLGKIPQFRGVWLENTAITGEGFRHWDKVKLAVLYGQGSKINDAGLGNLGVKPDLAELYLDNTPITDAGLVNLKNFPNLAQLRLNGTKITDAGLVYIKSLPGLANLWLNDTAITDAGLVHLADRKALGILDLSNTRVTPEGIRKLKAAIPRCQIVPGAN